MFNGFNQSEIFLPQIYTKNSLPPRQKFSEINSRFPQNSVRVCFWLPDQSAPTMPHNAPILPDRRPSSAPTAHSFGEPVQPSDKNQGKVPRKMGWKGGVIAPNSTADIDWESGSRSDRPRGHIDGSDYGTYKWIGADRSLAGRHGGFNSP
jgi:hypothetical protein